jgi:dihydrofolate synthase/folylpolyglutamate synthase
VIERVSLINTRYQQALDYIYSFIDYEKQTLPRDKSRYDIRRIKELLTRLGNPQLKSKTVHIAGSKGKGSVAAMVASVLTASGYKTGLYTSPHLHIFNERIRVDGNLITNEELVGLVDEIKPEVEAVNVKANYGQLTTFEIITALGFIHFSKKEVDFQVIEVGLGGTLDATNVVQPDICIITSISLEHTDVLGNTLAEIASWKAGIIKPGSTVVSSPKPEEADKVIEESCINNGAELVRADRNISWQSLESDSSQQSFQVKGRLGSYKLSVPLLGQHQVENALTAVTALEILSERGFHISTDSIAEGLEKVRWPGRLQIINHHPLVVVDGAHSPDSACKLRQALKNYFVFDKAILIAGFSSDKNTANIISELTPLFDKVIATHSIHPRALPTASVIAEFRKQGVEAQATEDISVALPLALTMAGENDLICVTGSLFVVAGAIEQAEFLFDNITG